MTDIESAGRELEAGRPVVVPTDTVYGIAASYRSPGAVERVFELKGRPPDKPLAVLAPDIDAVAEVARLPARARAIAMDHWPGPLTLVCRRAPGFSFDLGAGERDTVAVRVPAHARLLELLRATGPLAVTSANRSGRPAATTVAEARAEFGDEIAVYLDGGRAGGTESTVLSVVGEPRVLRRGALAERDVLQRVTE